MADAKIRLSVDGTAQVIVDLSSVEGKMLQLEKQVSSSGVKIKDFMTAATVSAAQTSAAMRQLPAQFTDIVTSLQGGQAPLTVLLQQGGQIKDSFGGAGNAAKALAGYIAGLANPYTVAAVAAAGLAYAYNEGAKEATAYNKAIIMTGNQAGTTAQQLADLASSVARATGESKGLAAEALTGFVSTGKVSADNLQKFSKVAVDAQRTMGVSIADTVAQFAELGKSPMQTLEKLSERYGFVTGEVYKTVMALEQQGKKTEAANIAQNAYADAIAKQRYAVLDSLTDWERGWERIKKMTMGAIDAALNVGREKGNMEKINDLLAQRESLERRVKDAAASGDTVKVNNLKERLVDNEKEINQIRSKEVATKAAAKAQADENEKNQAYVKWLDEGNQYLTKRQQMEKEIAAARYTAKAAGLQVKVDGVGTDGSEISDRVAAISRKYADINNSNIASLEAARRVEKEILAGSLADIESHHKQALISDADYVFGKRDLQLKDLDQEKALVQKQAAIAAGKADLSERQRYLGELQVIEEKRKAIIKNAQNALSEYSAVSGKYIDEQLSKWKNATLAEQDALVEELQLFGKSSEARKIQSAQLKIDAEVRESLARAKAGHIALMPDEIAKIQLEAMTRKANIAAIMGEKQALEGANQLREENLKFSAEYIFDEKDRAEAILAIDADKWRERIRIAGDGTEAQKRLQTEFDTWYANQSIKPQLDAQKEMWKSIDSAAHDAFINIFDSGKKVFDRLKDSLKSGLLDLLYQMTVKKWIVNIGGMFGMTGAAQASSGMGGIGSVVSGLSGVTSGLSNLYSLFTGGAQSAFNSFALSNMGMNLGLSSSLSSASTIGVGQLSGLGSTGQLGLTGMGQVGSSIAAAAPWVAAALAAYSIGTSAFGHGERQITGQNVTANVNSAGISGTKNVSHTKSGGWLSSDINGQWNYDLNTGNTVADGVTYNDWTGSTQKAGKAIKAGFDSLLSSTMDFSKSLGLSADAIKDKTYSLKFDFGSTDAEFMTNLTNALAGVADTMAQDLLPSITTLKLDGESAADAFKRLGIETTLVNTRIKDLGLTFNTDGLDTTALITAKDRLVQLTGGSQAFNDATSYFAANFLTEAERMQPTIDSVTKGMADLGYSNVTSVEQFKNLVRGIDTSTESGAKLFASLMALMPGFKTVADYMDTLGNSSNAAASALAQTNKSIQDQIDQLRVSMMTQDEQQQKMMQGQDESTQAKYRELFALQAQKQATEDAAKAATDAAAALAQTNKSIQDQIDQLRLSMMTQDEQRQKMMQGQDESTQAKYRELFALQAQKQAADDAAIASAAAAAALAQTNKSIQDQIDQLRLSMMTQDEQRQKMIQGQDESTQAKYRELFALQAQKEATDAAAAAAAQAAKAMEDAAAKTKAIADERYNLETEYYNLIGDTAELRKRELEKLSPENRAYKEKIYAEIDAQKAKQKAEQDAQAAQQAAQQVAQEAASAAAQLKSAWQSLADSIVSEVSRLRGLTSTSSAAGIAAAESQFAISTAQARAGDQDAMKLLPALSQALDKLYENTATSQAELSRNRAALAYSLEQTAGTTKRYGVTLPSYDIGTDYVPVDQIAQIHQGERITPAAYNRSDATNADLVKQMQILNEKIDRLVSAAKSSAESNKSTAEVLDNLTGGGGPALVKLVSA